MHTIVRSHAYIVVVVVSHICVHVNKQLRICPQVEPIKARDIKGMSCFHVGLVTHACVHAHFHLLLHPSPSNRTFQIMPPIYQRWRKYSIEMCNFALMGMHIHRRKCRMKRITISFKWISQIKRKNKLKWCNWISIGLINGRNRTRRKLDLFAYCI